MQAPYVSRAHPDVQAFALFYVDCYPREFIAEHLQFTVEQVDAAISREFKKRERWKTLPVNARKGTIGHEVISAEDRVCDSHGPYLAQQWALKAPPVGKDKDPLPKWLAPFWGNCPQCDRIMQDESNARYAEIKMGNNRHDMEAARKAARLRSGIPERYHAATMFNWAHPMDQQDRVWRLAMDFCSGFDSVLETGRSCAFTGAPGTGKTRLACSVLAHVTDKGGTGFYTTSMNLLGRIKDTYNQKATETEREVVEFFRSLDLLVIDEVGKQTDSNYDQSQLFRILDLRYQHMKPTILVANFSKDGLEKFLSGPVVDRLRENGGGILLFDWMSQRSSKRPPKADGGES